MLKTLSTTGNEPIKHHAVMRRADPLNNETRLLLSTPNQSGPSFDDDPNAMEMFGGLLLMCGCPLLIVIGIYAVVKASKNKG